ncbi:hypothetical protein BB560_003170 [Smittium megazygosporum]|uniref:J domain-containing protein n=1 Tax=Smittium megazygosporum TaxID=133381 RepID=A0A2T9ZCV5_9FUNG|nr:hypothetical protein BB560_003170 [Smittium megazygosporum]
MSTLLEKDRDDVVTHVLENSTLYYEILGIGLDSSSEEIKQAYKKSALILHPDRCDSPNSEEAFKAISKAFEVLSDPSKRKVYDLTLKAPETNTRKASNSDKSGNTQLSKYTETYRNTDSSSESDSELSSKEDAGKSRQRSTRSNDRSSGSSRTRRKESYATKESPNVRSRTKTKTKQKAELEANEDDLSKYRRRSRRRVGSRQARSIIRNICY